MLSSFFLHFCYVFLKIRVPLAYSSLGLTIVLYVISFISRGQFQKFRLINPRVLFALVVIFWTWLDHFNFSSRVRPRYGIDFTSSNMAPHSLYVFLGGSRFVEKQMTLHLEGLKFICHMVCHCSKRIRSFCIWSPSASLEITPYSKASSANKRTVELMLSGMSFIYTVGEKVRAQELFLGAPQMSRKLTYRRPTFADYSLLSSE
jgi:hypothetical protein